MTLVVQAHPLKDSFNAALLDAVVDGSPGAQVVRLCQGDSLSLADLAGTGTLVAVYPTWWGSVPAVLLDAINQLVGPWIDGNEPADTSPLRSITAVHIVTSHGSSKFVNRLQGEPGLQLWRRSIVPLCAPGASFQWQSMYGIDRASPTARTEFLRSVSSPTDI